jgi:excisionase family DNA binding protein
MSERKLLTLAEVAEQLRVSKNTAYALCRNGNIPSRKVGRQWRILQDDLEQWLSDQKRHRVSSRPGAEGDPLGLVFGEPRPD